MIAAPMSSVYPGMGASVLIICFVVVVIGGIGSITGALVASLLVGFVDTFGKVFFAECSGVGVYLLMAIVLVWRPEGLMRRKATECDAASRQRRCPHRPARPRLAAGRCCALPALTPVRRQDLVVKIDDLAIFALSLELLVGMTGLVSLGHAAFFGIGAYAMVLGSRRGRRLRSPWLLPLAMRRAPRPMRSSSARCSLRTRGVYFIMVTLAFAQMAYFVFHDTKLGGGSDGIYLYVKPALGVAGDAARPRRAPAVLLLRARRAGRHLRPARAAAGARASATRWPASASTSSACARPASRPIRYKLAAFVHRRRARRAGRLPARGQGRRRQSRAAGLARVGRGAADDHPRRHRPPARRGASAPSPSRC